MQPNLKLTQFGIKGNVIPLRTGDSLIRLEQRAKSPGAPLADAKHRKTSTGILQSHFGAYNVGRQTTLSPANPAPMTATDASFLSRNPRLCDSIQQTQKSDSAQ
uniref:Uncharacterized protein n=1 Tax=Romanomermis culicivorax TaxID=13658 RepID=A0A915KBJ8_ROMCU